MTWRDEDWENPHEGGEGVYASFRRVYEEGADAQALAMIKQLQEWADNEPHTPDRYAIYDIIKRFEQGG